MDCGARPVTVMGGQPRPAACRAAPRDRGWAGQMTQGPCWRALPCSTAHASSALCHPLAFAGAPHM
jgi:hypothetical protein